MRGNIINFSRYFSVSDTFSFPLQMQIRISSLRKGYSSQIQLKRKKNDRLFVQYFFTRLRNNILHPFKITFSSAARLTAPVVRDESLIFNMSAYAV